MKAFYHLLGLAYCSRPNYELKKLRSDSQNQVYAFDKEMETTKEEPNRTGFYRYGDRSNHLKAYVALPGQKLGQYNEYVAYISDFNFHVFSERESIRNFWRKVNYFGLHLTPTEFSCADLQEYSVRETFADFLFWNKGQLPKNVRPLMLMSNGRLVRGYWRRVEDEIEIYRPNPNAWKVYNPFPFYDRKKHVSKTYRKVDESRYI